MIRKTAVIMMLVLVSACAKTANIKPQAIDMNVSEGQFVPVRLFLNRSTPVPRFYVSRLEAVEASLKKSGAFFDIGTHVDSAVFLDMELSRGSNDSTLDMAGQLVSAATLFLVPSKVENFNQLSVDVYAYGKLLKRYEFRQDYSQVVGLHNYEEIASNQDNEFLSIQNLVNQFVNALNADQLLPKMKLAPAMPTTSEPAERPI